MERKRTSRASWVRPRWDLDPKIVCVYQNDSLDAISQLLLGSDFRDYLSRPRHSKRRNNCVRPFTSLWRQNTFGQRRNLGAMEHIQLRSFILKHPRKSKLFNRSPPVCRWIQSDVRRMRRFSLRWRLDVQDAIYWCRTRWRRTKTEVYLEEVMRRWFCWRLHCGSVAETIFC